MNISRLYLKFVEFAKREKAMASKGKKSGTSKRGNAMQLVTKITGVPDGVAGIMADYLAPDYCSDTSKQCENFRECHQNVCFRHVDKGRTVCRQCDREWRSLEDAYANRLYADDDNDEGLRTKRYD